MAVSPIRFEEYDRISDTVLYLNGEVTLKFNVTLAKKDMSGGRRFFAYETEYTSRYIGTNVARAINRNITYYWTIDIKKRFGDGLLINNNDIYFLRYLWKNQIEPWFFSREKRVFGIKDNMLIMKGKYSPAVYAISETKALSFEPLVLSYEDGTYKEGCRISINNVESIDITVDKLVQLFQILLETDMYNAALTLINYVKAQPYGVNIFKQQGLGGGYNNAGNWNDLAEDNPNEKGKNNFLDNAKRKE